jgi:hypothetical protein
MGILLEMTWSMGMGHACRFLKRFPVRMKRT